ncbi:hypothetical protein WCD74_22915 [Actinomycetospora sp. OC33-EN08]|uniref:Uncharacterized protein n=1 Tax=Actinomycetospora aurantiaca TaxID=3129233 RepID=A0ABU8MTK2_9PSEU
MRDTPVWAERARSAAWGTLANIDDLGLDDAGKIMVRDLARSITTLPDLVKVRQLRELLSSSRGLTVRTVVSWLDEVGPS